MSVAASRRAIPGGGPRSARPGRLDGGRPGHRDPGAFEQRTVEVRRKTAILDAGATVATFLLAYAVREATVQGEVGEFWAHLGLLPAIVPIWAVLLVLSGAYASPRSTTLWGYTRAVLQAVAGGLALLLAGMFLLKLEHVSRMVIVLFAVLDVAALTAIRFETVRRFRRAIRRGERCRKVLIVGTGRRAEEIAETLIQQSEWGVHIIGHLDPQVDRVGQRVLGAPVLGTIDEISVVLRDYVVDEVILAVPRSMIGEVEKVVRVCEEEGVTVVLMANVFDVNVARMGLVHLSSLPLLKLEAVAQDEWKLLIKRMIDLALVVAAMPVLLPVMGLIALAVRLDSAGPVLFLQERVGLAKRRFLMYKFRTMRVGSERLQAQLEHLNEAKGPIFKIKDDPRVTRVGRILRRTSLDELPQLFNVLQGEMSLVGPRPMSIRDVSLFDRGIQRRRFSVKPGLTCLWQISGRSQLPFSEWLRLDLLYIEQWSLTLDLKILLKTMPVVLRGTGAA
jgi:exopolysaccharide biosynthesis polyprenyl glycosylphosphotransferase